MIVKCTECLCTGKLDEELAGKLVRCPRCSAPFVAKAAVAQKNWYYAAGANKIGPIGQEQFDRLVADGTVAPETLVWTKGMADWQTLTQALPPRPKKWYYAAGPNKLGPFRQEQFDRLVADGTVAPETLVWTKGMAGWQTLAQALPPRPKKWYYAAGPNKLGPFRQEQFDRLVADGTVAPETLVWVKGMADWQTLAEISPTTRATECEKCGDTFTLAHRQSDNGSRLCAACALLSPSAMAPPSTSEVPGLKYGFLGSRLIAKIIDLTFMLALAALIEGLSRKLFPASFDTKTVSLVFGMTLLLNMLLGLFYITWFVGKLGATPGKIVFKLKITDPSGGKIGYGHAFGRYCGEFIASLGGVSCLILFLFLGIGNLFPATRVFTTVPAAVFLAFAIVYGPALVDKKRRTLYDRLCNTRVIAA